MSLRVVVTGTDTGLGKTVFTAGLAHHLGASYWKPVQAGLAGESDSEVVRRLGGLGAERILPEAWRLNTPVSPHQAAGIDGVVIDAAGLAVPQPSGPLMIEGAGGLMVPLTPRLTFLDVLVRWQLPVILCARTGLGTINHSLLSLEALRRRAIPVLGIAFIGDAMPETESIISDLGRAPVLGRLPRLVPLSHATLAPAFAHAFAGADFSGRRG